MIKMSISNYEFISILFFCHSYVCGGYFGVKGMSFKVFKSGFYWPTLLINTFLFCKLCDHCQWISDFGAWNQMP
jgi:hypothetical protein